MGEIEDRLNRNMYMLFKQKKHTIFVAVKKGGVLKLELAEQKNCCFDVFWVVFNTNYPHFSAELELVASMTSIMACMSPLLN